MKLNTMKIPQVSVIVATKNEEKNIERCLRSIKNQSIKAEIIVVDNFSSDKTVQIAKQFTAKVYLFGNERSKQRNFGAQKTHGEYLLFLDADMELPSNLLKECLEQFQKNSKISGIIIDEESKGYNFLSRIKSLEKRLTNRETVIEAARFFKKTDLLKMSGYDEDLISGEDWDLSIRMSRLGPLARVKSKILHHEGKTFWQDVKKKYYYAKNIQEYAEKNPKEFEKQAGFWRFSSLFKKPKIILENPVEFIGLIFLKSAHYFTYLLAKTNPLVADKKKHLNAEQVINNSKSSAAFKYASKLLNITTFYLLLKSRKTPFKTYYPHKISKKRYPKLSVIFPNFNGNKTLLKTLLRSIARSNYPRELLETIMVDNGSGDTSVEFVSKTFPEVKIIKLKKNYGFAKAVNIAVSRSKGNYIFITNNDVELEKNCLKSLVEFLIANREVGVAGGKVLDFKYRNKISSSALAFNFLIGSFIMSKDINRIQNSDWISGCCFLCSKSLWQKLNGFDEKFFFTAEDLDFCLRAKYLGYKIIYYPKAIIWHVQGETIKRQGQKIKVYETYKSKIRLILKHASPIEIITSLLIQFAVFLPYRTIFTRETIAFYLFKAFLWNLKNRPKNLYFQRKGL